MRRGSFGRDFLKVRKVKVGTLGTIEHCFIIKDLAWNITWNIARTLGGQVDKVSESPCLTSIIYFVMLETSISPKLKGLPRCYNDRS
jgi:hypothetical protein